MAMFKRVLSECNKSFFPFPGDPVGIIEQGDGGTQERWSTEFGTLGTKRR